jgi:hypothetical protein
MEEKNNFWFNLSELLNVGVSGYGTYKQTTWIDKLISFIPFAFLLIFLYLLLRGKK